MLTAELAGPEEREALAELVDRWAHRHKLDPAGVVAAVDRHPIEARWYVRLRGEEKAAITVWLTLRERTLHVETQVMPAPEENLADCYEYLLRRNATSFSLRFALGPEDAVYLVGHLPLSGLDEGTLDQVVGAAYAYTEECFPTAMGIGYASRYRRRSRRG